MSRTIAINTLDGLKSFKEKYEAAVRHYLIHNGIDPSHEKRCVLAEISLSEVENIDTSSVTDEPHPSADLDGATLVKLHYCMTEDSSLFLDFARQQRFALAEYIVEKTLPTHSKYLREIDPEFFNKPIHKIFPELEHLASVIVLDGDDEDDDDDGSVNSNIGNINYGEELEDEAVKECALRILRHLDDRGWTTMTDLRARGLFDDYHLAYSKIEVFTMKYLLRAGHIIGKFPLNHPWNIKRTRKGLDFINSIDSTKMPASNSDGSTHDDENQENQAPVERGAPTLVSILQQPSHRSEKVRPLSVRQSPPQPTRGMAPFKKPPPGTPFRQRKSRMVRYSPAPQSPQPTRTVPQASLTVPPPPPPSQQQPATVHATMAQPPPQPSGQTWYGQNGYTTNSSYQCGTSRSTCDQGLSYNQRPSYNQGHLYNQGASNSQGQSYNQGNSFNQAQSCNNQWTSNNNRYSYNQGPSYNNSGQCHNNHGTSNNQGYPYNQWPSYNNAQYYINQVQSNNNGHLYNNHAQPYNKPTAENTVPHEALVDSIVGVSDDTVGKIETEPHHLMLLQQPQAVEGTDKKRALERARKQQGTTAVAIVNEPGSTFMESGLSPLKSPKTKRYRPKPSEKISMPGEAVENDKKQGEGKSVAKAKQLSKVKQSTEEKEKARSLANSWASFHVVMQGKSGWFNAARDPRMQEKFVWDSQFVHQFAMLQYYFCHQSDTQSNTVVVLYNPHQKKGKWPRLPPNVSRVVMLVDSSIKDGKKGAGKKMAGKKEHEKLRYCVIAVDLTRTGFPYKKMHNLKNMFRVCFYDEMVGDTTAMKQQRWQAPYRWLVDKRLELFDLKKDGEKHNVHFESEPLFRFDYNEQGVDDNNAEGKIKSLNKIHPDAGGPLACAFLWELLAPTETHQFDFSASVSKGMLRSLVMSQFDRLTQHFQEAVNAGLDPETKLIY